MAPLAQPSQLTHAYTLRRYPRGYSVPWNRTTYGYTVQCSCGWRERVNGTKRDAERAGRAHLRSPLPPGGA